MEQIQNSPTHRHMHIHAQTDACFEHTQIHPGRHIRVCALTQIVASKCPWTLHKSQTSMEKTRKSSSPSAPASVRSFPAVHLHFVQPSFNYARQCGYFLVSGSIILPPSMFHCHNFFHHMLPEFPFL